MLLPEQILLHDLSLSEEEIDKKLTAYFATHPVLTRSNMQSLCCFTQSMASRQIRRLKAKGNLQNIGKPTQPIHKSNNPIQRPLKQIATIIEETNGAKE